MSAQTFEEARQTYTQIVIAKLSEKFDPTKWAVITPISAGAECDILEMLAAVFTVDLEMFEAVCAAATDCTFDKAVYVPYAFGFLWQEGAEQCSSSGPYIMTKPGSTLPFEAFYWNSSSETVGMESGISYDDASHYFYYEDYEECEVF